MLDFIASLGTYSYGSSLSGVRNVSLEIALTIVKIARVRHGIIHDIQRLLWLILLILLLLRRGIQRARILLLLLLLLLLLTICRCTRRCCRVIIACRGCCDESLLKRCWLLSTFYKKVSISKIEKKLNNFLFILL